VRNLKHAPEGAVVAYTLGDASAALGISPAKLYEMIKAGTIRTTVIGGRRVVPRSEMLRLAENGDGSTCGRGGNAHEARRMREVKRAALDAAERKPALKRQAAK
jgi:excisionase family DNA binding protein